MSFIAGINLRMNPMQTSTVEKYSEGVRRTIYWGRDYSQNAEILLALLRLLA